MRPIRIQTDRRARSIAGDGDIVQAAVFVGGADPRLHWEGWGDPRPDQPHAQPGPVHRVEQRNAFAPQSPDEQHVGRRLCRGGRLMNLWVVRMREIAPAVHRRGPLHRPARHVRIDRMKRALFGVIVRRLGKEDHRPDARLRKQPDCIRMERHARDDEHHICPMLHRFDNQIL